MLKKPGVYDQSDTSPVPVISPPSPDFSNSAAAEITIRGSYTEGRKKWTESKVNSFLTYINSSLHI